MASERAVEAVNNYGNERDWQKMRPDEIVALVEPILRQEFEAEDAATKKGAQDAG